MQIRNSEIKGQIVREFRNTSIYGVIKGDKDKTEC